MKIFLDVETLPPEPADPSIRDRLSEFTEEEFRRLALDGSYGRILCIGVLVERDGEVACRGVLGRDRDGGQFHLDETRTLRSFWRLVKDFNAHRDLLVGFNILDFDLHFICCRSVIRQVRPTVNVCFARFRSQPVYDTMWEYSHWRHRIKLDDVAKILGLDSSKRDGITGGEVYNLFCAGRHQDIADYCLRDVELTRAIYRRLNFLDP